MDEFVADNANISYVDLKMCSWDMGNVLDNSRIVSL
jgi:hypothetical protein